MLGIRTRQWDPELIEALGVRAEQFPVLGDIHDKINGLTPTYASRWPTLRDVPWFPAIGDGAAANIGSGCVSEDKFALTIGTSSAIRVVVAPEQVVPPPGLWLYFVDAKRALLGGALSEGGNIFAWLGKTVQITSLKEVDAEVAKLPPDGHGLTILPFISGERSLGWHAEARAVIAGINAHISPVEIVRATQEALAYQLGAVYQELKTALKLHEKPPILVASGGALLSSPSLQQIVADTLASPLYPTYEQEASARGAALLALEAIGVVPDVAHLAPKLAESVQPDAQRSAIYQQGAQRQRQLYQALLGSK
jgi:gluconokinase